jgi:hypothetical protein
MRENIRKINSRAHDNALCYCLILLFSWPDYAQSESLGFSLALRAGVESSTLQVQVIDDITHTPIEGAGVTVSDSLGTAEASFVIEAETPKDGVIHFARPTSGPLTLGVFKENYIAFAIVGIQSDEATVFLKPLQLPDQYTLVKGELGGWNPSPGKKFVQAGLVFRSMSAMDLLDFQVQSFFSPLKDTLEVMGKREIPSNVSLPDQEVAFLLGTLRLNKPAFRIPLYSQRKIRLAALQGSSKVSDVIAAVQGGGFNAELLNKLNFTRFGISSALEPIADLKLDFNADYVLSPLQREVRITRPPFPADVIVLSGMDLEGDRQVLIPMDIKTAISIQNPNQIKEVKLAGLSESIENSQTLIVTTAVGKNAKRLSGVITESKIANVQVGEFINVKEIGDFRQLPDRVGVVAPLQGVGMLTLCAKGIGPRFEGMSEVEFPQNPGAEKTAEYHYTTEIIYVLPVAGEVKVPIQTVHSIPKISKYAVSQVEFNPAFDERIIDGNKILQKIRRFTSAFAQQEK